MVPDRIMYNSSEQLMTFTLGSENIKHNECEMLVIENTKRSSNEDPWLSNHQKELECTKNSVYGS